MISIKNRVKLVQFCIDILCKHKGMFYRNIKTLLIVEFCFGVALDLLRSCNRIRVNKKIFQLSCIVCAYKTLLMLLIDEMNNNLLS